MTGAKGRKRRRPAKSTPHAAAEASVKQPTPQTDKRRGADTLPGSAVSPAVARTQQAGPMPGPEKATANEQKEQEPRWPIRALTSMWTWIGAATAGAVGTVMATVILPPSSPAAPSAMPTPAARSSGVPITALIDLSGSGPCGSPQTVVPRPGPVGKSIYVGYTGQPPSGGWLNVLVQGNGGEPVTVESVTAKVISRRTEKPGVVLYSYCQGYSPSHTYVRLDLRASQPTATAVPEPNPTEPATVVPLPIEVTGDSPAQFYIQPVSGDMTVRWSLQIHWERGNDSGTLTAAVSNGQSSAAGALGSVITTVGTDGDPVLCPDGTGDVWVAVKGQAC